ncbi:hypothetical protein [Luteimonas terrae]|uniref:Uncharacterized protein n=1 Tax=Luteimonas terrae TaxID=1530191 RepID=A0ABU1XXS2_9GAMM|nr:hypothetical protein [Luteimonas terrae]MDR7193393.1 hypothetical protein [Luteimonas terrae]
MAIIGGFGTTYDLQTGTARHWYIGRDGVKRWSDTDTPVDAVNEAMTSESTDGEA